MAVVSADYRLAPQAPIPQIMEDVRDAATWVREKLPGILGDGVVDPSRLVVGGHSAGKPYLAARRSVRSAHDWNLTQVAILRSWRQAAKLESLLFPRR